MMEPRNSTSELTTSRTDFLWDWLIQPVWAGFLGLLASCNPQANKVPKNERSKLYGGAADQEEGHECVPINTVDFKLATTDIPSSLECKICVYPSLGAPMVVVAIPKYGHDGANNLATIGIIRESGEVLALRTITNGQIAPDKSLRPVSFHLDEIKEGDQISVFLISNNEKQYVVKLNSPVVYLRKFQGLDARTVYDTSYGNFYAKTSYEPSEDPASVRAELEEYWKTSFYTVERSTKFNPNPALRGCIITDLAGNVLTDNGESFIDIVNHPEFIVYKKTTIGFDRTFVRIG